MALINRLLNKQYNQLPTDTNQAESIPPSPSTAGEPTGGTKTAQDIMREKFGGLAGMIGMLSKLLPEEYGGDLIGLIKALDGPVDVFHAKLVEFRNVFSALLEVDYAAGIGDRNRDIFNSADSAAAGEDSSGRQDTQRQNDAEGPAPLDLAPQISNGPGSHSGFEAAIQGRVDSPGTPGEAFLSQVEKG